MGAIYWVALLVTGTDIINASLFVASIIFGLMSVSAAGGIKTAPGLLNFILIAKFVLIAVTLKTLTWQAADSGLHAPRTTGKVMALGFFALYLASLIYRHVVKLKGLVTDVEDPQLYLSLTVFFSVVCIGSTFVILIFQTSYDTMLTGGFWGIAHQFEAVTAFCVVPAMYWAWSSGQKRFLSHPLVVGILIAELAIGVALTTKQGMMEPLLCYLGVGFIRYGIRSRVVWSILGAGLFCYMTIVYPYSQYVRSHGGRDGTLKERLDSIQEVFFGVSTDSEFRSNAESSTTENGETYLGKDSLRPVSRLAMIGEADRLIAATDETQSFTGWETIINGMKLMVPSFLIGDKPTSGGGNFLGHVAGDLAPDDMTTQVSYGVMANLYNAFGLTGVLLGTIAFFFVFYYVLKLWFADSDLSMGPWGGSVWYLLIGTMYEHGLVEGPIGNILPSLINLSAIVGLIFAAKFWVNFSRRRHPADLRPYY